MHCVITQTLSFFEWHRYACQVQLVFYKYYVEYDEYFFHNNARKVYLSRRAIVDNIYADIEQYALTHKQYKLRYDVKTKP